MLDGAGLTKHNILVREKHLRLAGVDINTNGSGSRHQVLSCILPMVQLKHTDSRAWSDSLVLMHLCKPHQRLELGLARALVHHLQTPFKAQCSGSSLNPVTQLRKLH